MMERVMGIDPGDKRIGIAISDSTGILAKPFTVIKHISRQEDAQFILNLAEEQEVGCIVVGKAFQEDGSISVQGRKAEHLAEVLHADGRFSVVLWDESGSTQKAQAIRREMGVPRRKRSGHLDALAAAVILQEYLDTQQEGKHE